MSLYGLKKGAMTYSKYLSIDNLFLLGYSH